MSAWSTAWVLWGLAFAVVEAVAVFNDRDGDTLSEHVRRWFRVDTRPGRTLFLAGWAAFAAWFLVHILTGTV